MSSKQAYFTKVWYLHYFFGGIAWPLYLVLKYKNGLKEFVFQFRTCSWGKVQPLHLAQDQTGCGKESYEVLGFGLVQGLSSWRPQVCWIVHGNLSNQHGEVLHLGDDLREMEVCWIVPPVGGPNVGKSVCWDSRVSSSSRTSWSRLDVVTHCVWWKTTSLELSVVVPALAWQSRPAVHAVTAGSHFGCVENL